MTDRFSTGARRYDSARPSYPDRFLTRLAEAVTSASEGVILDVGAGTGIFTRQLKTLFPNDTVIGVEPSEAMRAEAGEDVVEGSADRLPAKDASARLVTAASAAHWFDRAPFYAEARRVLRPGGVLAILDYPRDEEGSTAARTAELFLRELGEPKQYDRPDYKEELAALDGFEGLDAVEEAIKFPMTQHGFVELVLSSSHARAVEAALGETETRQRLERLAGRLANENGRVSYGYRFRLAMVRRSAGN